MLCCEVFELYVLITQIEHLFMIPYVCDHLLYTEEILKDLLTGYFYTVPIKTASSVDGFSEKIF